MQLNRFTDLGMRVLIYLTQPPRPAAFTISAMAEELLVSHHHLVKVVHFMARQGWVKTTRGKGGGIMLAQAANTYRVGQCIRILESHSQQGNPNQQAVRLVDCHSPPCILRSSCTLHTALDGALQQFFAYLDQYTLTDMVKLPVQQAISPQNRIQLLDLLKS